MKQSDRILNLTPGGDDGWGVFYRARAMVAAGEPVIELTIGEHDIRTDPSILEAMHRAAASGHTGYASVPGTPKLRQTVADRITKQTGVETNPENIVITTGGQAALLAAHMATCDPDDVAIILDPYYATYPGTVRATGADLRIIPCKPENNFQPSRADLETAAKDAKTILINTPNNPTGVVYSKDTIQMICDIAVENNIWIISDEVYDTQVWDGTHLSPRQIKAVQDRTLVIGSMSKSHAMTGSRVGWICGPTDVVANIINLSTHSTYGVPGYIQDAAVFALNEGQPLEDKIAAPFARRRKIAQDLIAKQNVVRAVPPQGAMYIMLDIRATGMTGQDFANGLLDAAQIAVMPGESFGTAAAGHIRVAMTVDDDRFAEAMVQLLRFAEAQVP